MEDMNQKQQLPNLQERFEFSQETSIEVHRPLCELRSSLINYFKLPHQERLESQATSFIQEHKDRWRRLNWEKPGQEEYQTVTEILKTQTELLQQDYNQGRAASLNQLLMALLRSLWKYFMFNSQRHPALTPNFVSLNNHREWEKFHQAILRLSTNLQQNIPERGTALKLDVKMILYHLKESTAGWTTQDSQSTRYTEDQELDILDAHPVL